MNGMTSLVFDFEGVRRTSRSNNLAVAIASRTSFFGYPLFKNAVHIRELAESKSGSVEHILLILSAWLYGMLRFWFSGWLDL